MYCCLQCVAMGVIQKLSNHTPDKIEVILVEYLCLVFKERRNANRVLDILIASLLILVVLLLSSSDTVCAGLTLRI